jgi:hypothetical protein
MYVYIYTRNVLEGNEINCGGGGGGQQFSRMQFSNAHGEKVSMARNEMK